MGWQRGDVGEMDGLSLWLGKHSKGNGLSNVYCSLKPYFSKKQVSLISITLHYHCVSCRSNRRYSLFQKGRSIQLECRYIPKIVSKTIVNCLASVWSKIRDKLSIQTIATTLSIRSLYFITSLLMPAFRRRCYPADISLSERSVKDLTRNALISVFLRALEYHDGILILPSNHAGHLRRGLRIPHPARAPLRKLGHNPTAQDLAEFHESYQGQAWETTSRRSTWTTLWAMWMISVRRL